MKFSIFFLLSGGLIGLYACQSPPVPAPSAAPASASPPAPVNDPNYWYQGKAEISSYEVTQERYGELRRAGQVMVFVTEDFSDQKQVKLDAAPAPGDARVPVLKLNTVRRFETGIYDYSLMQSVFTPVEAPDPRSLKLTTTIQDWCGHIFMQCNATPEAYRVQSFSYFESEGDAELEIKPDLLEDEIWTRLRLNPESLASRKAMVLPGVFYNRMRHKPLKTEPADISIEKNGAESTLILAYANIPRRLTIRFETAFPHRILAWEESDNGALLSKGTLKNTFLDAYWQHHDEASAPLRTRLDPGF